MMEILVSLIFIAIILFGVFKSFSAPDAYITIGETAISKELYRGKNKHLLNLSAGDVINIDGKEYIILSKGYNSQTKEWFISVKNRI